MNMNMNMNSGEWNNCSCNSNCIPHQDQYTYHHEMFAQFTRRSAHTIIGRRLASTYTTSKPSSLKGVLFGFFAGVSITGFGCYYYLLDEYKTSSDAIISDILLLQKTIRNMETHIRTLESSIEKK